MGSVFGQRLEILISCPHSSTICHRIAHCLVGCLLPGGKNTARLLTSAEKRWLKLLSLMNTYDPTEEKLISLGALHILGQ